ncbi:GNAT family N-acetyltransferase [Flexivirga alba]|uniref:GNAT family N-acetyltransferase n=1 Tax=Flexivirga alba TaxID=702742 RepID=A0ABW2AEG0_9MICO
MAIPTTLHFYSPTTDVEAIDLLASSPTPFDSPTQRRLRTELHLLDAFGTGRRRPEWVWAVRDDTDRQLGVLAALGADQPSDQAYVLDIFGLPDDPQVALSLTARATSAVLAAGAEEACIYAPPGTTYDAPALRLLADALTGAGWRLFVERRHYEFEPPAGLGDGPTTELSFTGVTDPGDPALAACHREVMRETLDAHDADRITRLGFEAACEQSLADLLEADPVECIHLARNASGAVVGMVSGRVLPTGRAFVLFVGTTLEHRGHGYGRQLLAWQTRRLLAERATVLIADTDNANLPMARAFAEVGWPQTETRIDLRR